MHLDFLKTLLFCKLWEKIHFLGLQTRSNSVKLKITALRKLIAFLKGKILFWAALPFLLMLLTLGSRALLIRLLTIVKRSVTTSLCICLFELSSYSWRFDSIFRQSSVVSSFINSSLETGLFIDDCDFREEVDIYSPVSFVSSFIWDEGTFYGWD